MLNELKKIVNFGDPYLKYSLIEKIGIGATGTVWTARSFVTDKIVAVKRMNFYSQPKKEMLLTEIKVMQQYQHKVKKKNSKKFFFVIIFRIWSIILIVIWLMKMIYGL